GIRGVPGQPPVVTEITRSVFHREPVGSRRRARRSRPQRESKNGLQKFSRFGGPIVGAAVTLLTSRQIAGTAAGQQRCSPHAVSDVTTGRRVMWWRRPVCLQTRTLLDAFGLSQKCQDRKCWLPLVSRDALAGVTP